MNQKHDREKVLRSGLHLFCSKGYNNLGVDEICKTTGMTKGAFYHAFEDKENFLLEAISTYGQNQVRYIHGKLDSTGEVKAIDRLKNFYLRMLEYQPEVNYMGCMINNMMSELGAINELVGKATSIEFARFVEAIEPTVKEAQQDGDLTPHISSEKMTELIHTTFYGTLTRAKSLSSAEKGIETMHLLFQTLSR
ncbi:MAG: TetR/AcrR family transcriptional regulator [Saprospirales bacterium]|nr:TetR/AcrR family transcriptional regulator [Saprospirales bacterium]